VTRAWPGWARISATDPSSTILPQYMTYTRWQKRAATGEPLELFVETIPFLETRAYVVRVMGNLARYGYLERGEAGVPTVPLELR